MPINHKQLPLYHKSKTTETMKRIITTLSLCFSLCTFAQQTILENVKQEIEKYENSSYTLFKNKEYSEAIQTAEKAIKLIESSNYEKENPGTRAMLKSCQARCYYRLEELQNAVDLCRESVELYSKNVSENNEEYAILIDNLSLYLTEIDKYDEAIEYNKKACTYFEKEKPQSLDHAVALMRRAELYKYTQNMDSCIDIQKKAVDAFKISCGAHSELYIKELKYLAKYHSEKGDNPTYDKIMKEVEQLETEAKYGYVPAIKVFNSKEQVQESNEDALMCSKFIMTHTLNSPSMGNATAYIIAWSASSPDVNITISDSESEWMSHKNGGKYLPVYIAGWVNNALTEQDKEDSFDNYVCAYVAMINSYISNKKTTGKVPAIEKYIKTYESGQDALIDLLEEKYNKMKAQKTNAK